MLRKGQRKGMIFRILRRHCYIFKNVWIAKALTNKRLSASFVLDRLTKAARCTHPSAVALLCTFVNTEDTNILTPTIEADLQKEKNIAHASVLPWAHAHARVRAFTEGRLREVWGRRPPFGWCGCSMTMTCFSHWDMDRDARLPAQHVSGLSSVQTLLSSFLYGFRRSWSSGNWFPCDFCLKLAMKSMYCSILPPGAPFKDTGADKVDQSLSWGLLRLRGSENSGSGKLLREILKHGNFSKTLTDKCYRRWHKPSTEKLSRGKRTVLLYLSSPCRGSHC